MADNQEILAKVVLVNGVLSDRANELLYNMDGPVLTIKEQSNHSDYLQLKNIAGTLVCKIDKDGNLTCHNVTANDISAHDITANSVTSSGNMTATNYSGTSMSLSGSVASGSLSTGSGTFSGALGGTSLTLSGAFTGQEVSCSSVTSTGSINGATLSGTTLSLSGNLTGQGISGTSVVSSGAVTGASLSVTGSISGQDATLRNVTMSGSLSLGTDLTVPNLLTDAVKQKTSTGLKLGASGEKVAFYGGTPIVKPAVGATVSATAIPGSAGILFGILEQGLFNTLLAKVNEQSIAINKLQTELKNLGLVQS